MIRLEPLEDLIAVELGQPEIEHDELRPHSDGALNGGHAIVDELARQAVLGETLAEGRTRDGIVVDDQDRRPSSHGQ